MPCFSSSIRLLTNSVSLLTMVRLFMSALSRYTVSETAVKKMSCSGKARRQKVGNRSPTSSARKAAMPDGGRREKPASLDKKTLKKSIKASN